MPTLETVALDRINEPPLPMRIGMDEKKMAELQASMADVGLLQPLLLIVNGDRYDIEAGHRRFIAAQALRWPGVMSLVYKPGELRQGGAMFAENRFREDASAAEEAIYFAEHRERDKLTEADLCARFGVSADYLADRFRLLQGSKEVFEALLRREINFSVARELNKCTDPAQCKYFLDLAIRGGTTARLVARWVSDWKIQQTAAPAPVEAPPASAPADAPVVNPVYCFLCGGDRDPYNLTMVYIHKWELEQLLAQINAKAQGGV